MQLLGVLIFLGILALLFLGAKYFGSTQKTPNRQSGSAMDNFYHSRGMGNVLSAREKLDEISADQRRSSPRGHQHMQHTDHDN